jgi:hypothetical protein
MSSKTDSPTPTINGLNSSCTIGSHINRAFMCQIRYAEPTPKESNVLDKQHVDTHEALRSYYVWRRSTLMVAIPFIFIGMIFGLMDLFHQLRDAHDANIYNGFGKLLILIQNIDSVFLFAGVVAGYVWWPQFKKSIQAVRIAFLVSFVLPLIPALFPLELSLNRQTVITLDEANYDLFGLKVVLSLSYMLSLLPVIISFPGGLLRAALRIRWLLPESMLSGWILVISAPFYSLLLCITLIIVLQVAGNILLFFGTVMVVLAPWVYVIRGRVFVHLWTEEKKKQVLLAQRISGIVTLVGYVLIIIFAFTGNVSGVGFVGKTKSSTDGDDRYDDDSTSSNDGTTYLLNYTQAFRIFIETIGRLFITTLMFCDALLRMNLESWQDHETSRLKNEDEIGQRYKAFTDSYENNGKTNNDEINKSNMTHDISEVSYGNDGKANTDDISKFDDSTKNNTESSLIMLTNYLFKKINDNRDDPPTHTETLTDSYGNAGKTNNSEMKKSGTTTNTYTTRTLSTPKLNNVKKEDPPMYTVDV